MDDGRSGARLLAAEFFRQLSEKGETELYLPAGELLAGEAVSPGGARAEEGSAATAPGRATADAPTRREPTRLEPARREPAAEAATPAPAAEKPSPAKPAVKSAARLAPEPDLPEVEVVRVKLAFSSDATTGDMFAQTAGLDACSTLDDVQAASSGCTKCELAGGRTNVVFGVGNPSAKLMFIGEAPGRDEDIQGVPFVGRAGQLLNKILDAAGIERDDVYIANIIKCRPPNNRTPLTNEIDACIPYLGRQVALIKPRIICTLGLPATQTLLGIRGSMGSLRGKMYVEGDVVVVPTYHPAAALRDPKYKRPIWDDFQLIIREYRK